MMKQTTMIRNQKRCSDCAHYDDANPYGIAFCGKSMKITNEVCNDFKKRKTYGKSKIPIFGIY